MVKIESPPIQSHISIYGTPNDPLSGGIRGGGDRFLSAVLNEYSYHGWPVELVTNSAQGVIFQEEARPKMTRSGKLYTAPGVARLPFTPEETKGLKPLLLTDPDVLDRATDLLRELLTDPDHRYTIPIAHHYTSAEVLARVRNLYKPIVVIPHALNIFRHSSRRSS